MWGSGDIETREYDLSGFTAVNVGSGFKIEIIQSDTFGVTVRADDNIFRKIVVRTSGDTLHLHTKPFHWSIGHTNLEATIRMPSLTVLEVSGAASARVPAFHGIRHLDLNLNGASELRGRIQVESIDLLATGASRASLAGSAKRAVLEASGASKLDLGELIAATGAVQLSGASSASVNFTDTIDAIEVSGASKLRYLGNPRMGYVDSSGASRVARVA